MLNGYLCSALFTHPVFSQQALQLNAMLLCDFTASAQFELGQEVT